MGAKKIGGIWLIQNGAMVGTSTITSAAQNIDNLDNVGLEVTWSGTPTGMLTVLGSISAGLFGVPDDLVNYYAFTFDPALPQPLGAPGGYLIDLNQVPFTSLEVSYTNTGGDGILNVFLFKKDLN
jgi:hypothetical protein